jgi:hypothetical protein
MIQAYEPPATPAAFIFAVGTQVLFFGRVPGTFAGRRYYILAGSQVRKCPVIGRGNEGGVPQSA